MRSTLALIALTACGGASVHLSLDNQTVTGAARSVRTLPDGASMRLKIISVSLAPDVDPVTMDNIGESANIWLNPQCNGDPDGCNVDGFAAPAGPRITDYFDLAEPTATVDAELNSQGATITPGSYRYARLELCKATGGATMATVPTMMWAGPGMTEQPFTSGDCGRTSLAFDPPLDLADGDSVEVTLGYDLSQAIVTGAPAMGDMCGLTVAGHEDQCYRACVDLSSTERTCMDFPDFSPGATKI